MPKDQTLALSFGPDSVEPLWYKFALGTHKPVFTYLSLLYFWPFFLVAHVISLDVEADVSWQQLGASVMKDLIVTAENWALRVIFKASVFNSFSLLN